MKYSLNAFMYSSCPAWVPAYPLKDTIERIARLGYDALELGAVAPHAWPYYLDAAKRQEINGWLRDNNIVVSSILANPGGGPGANPASAVKEEREWTVQHLKDVCDLGIDLDCTMLLYVTGWYIYGTKRQEAWNYSLESLVEVGRYAAEKGANVCIEPTPDGHNLVETADDALLMMEQSGLSNVSVMFDTTHAFYRNEPSSDYIYKMGQNLKHTHFADYGRMPPGTAGADFVPIMQALKDIDYQGYITMELFPERKIAPDTFGRQAIENLKRIEAELK